jgi:hypothetical protein
VFAEQQPSQQTNKIFLYPFYRASMTNGQSYNYTFDIMPPDGLNSVSSAIVSFDVYINPTVTFNASVNGVACRTPGYTISTTYASAGQAGITFDCGNVINKKGNYVLTLKPTSQNTGAITGWVDVTYVNEPRAKVEVHGTEYTYGQEGKVWLQLLNSTGQTINNGVCYLDIYSPSGDDTIERALMNNFNHDGIYYYDFSIPLEQGVYPVVALCYYTASLFPKFLSNYTLINGTYNSGTINNTISQDGSILRLQEVNLAPIRKFEAIFNFSASGCNNISESFLNGFTVYWYGKWDSVTNDYITMSIYNYSSQSWITMNNQIISQISYQTVSNSISSNNFTKAGIINATNNNFLIKFTDVNMTDGAVSNLDTDEFYVSCDHFLNPNWQLSIGSSEVHVTSEHNYLIQLDSVQNINSTSYPHGGIQFNYTVSSGTSMNLTNQEVIIQGSTGLSCPSSQDLIQKYNSTSLMFENVTYSTKYNFDGNQKESCDIIFTQTLEKGANYYYVFTFSNLWAEQVIEDVEHQKLIYETFYGLCNGYRISKGYAAYTFPMSGMNNTDVFYGECQHYYNLHHQYNLLYNSTIIYDLYNISSEINLNNFLSSWGVLLNYDFLIREKTTNILKQLTIDGLYGQLILSTSPYQNLSTFFWANLSTAQYNYRLLTALNMSSGSNLTAADVWSYNNRTLTTSWDSYFSYWNNTLFSDWDSKFTVWNNATFPELKTNITNTYDYMINTLNPQLTSIKTDTTNILLNVNCNTNNNICSNLTSIIDSLLIMQNSIYNVNSTSVAQIISSLSSQLITINSINSTVNNLWTSQNCTINYTSVCVLLNQINSTNNNILSVVGTINTTSSTQILDDINSQTRLIMSDFGRVTSTNNYLAKIWAFNFVGGMKSIGVPNITIYDPYRNIVVNQSPMNYVDLGLYEYNLTLGTNETTGVWESITTINTGNGTVYLSDYWEVFSNPAMVDILSVTDSGIPTISANVIITNEGTDPQEYYYTYCVVDDISKDCSQALDVGSASKLINPGDSYTPTLTLNNVNVCGDLYFKLLVTFGGDEPSSAIESFTSTGCSSGTGGVGLITGSAVGLFAEYKSASNLEKALCNLGIIILIAMVVMLIVLIVKW